MHKITPFAPPSSIWQAFHAKAEAEHLRSFVSRKNRRALPVWGELDLWFCEFAESSPSILCYEERPELIILDDRRRAVPFVADFRVTTREGHFSVVLSYSARPANHEEKRIIRLAEVYCLAHGEELLQVTERDLRPLSPTPVSVRIAA